ncbi:MAG: hypothetical protein ACI4TH_00300 [Candidatus Ornithomonoglobus sp.]
MKFETPKMNISMFAAENVVTEASAIMNSETVEAAKNALTAANSSVTAENTVVFTF